jgi:glucose-6-phosphate isomerase
MQGFLGRIDFGDDVWVKNIEFSFGDAMIPQQRIFETAERLRPEIRRMTNAISEGCEGDLASLCLVDDRLMLGKVRQAIGENLQLKPVYLVVVGIGGSNLGTIAVQEAVLGKLYNQLTAATKVLYADTVDSDGINNIITLVKPVLEKGGNIALNVISKSGTTTETIANAQVLIDLLRRHKKDYKNCITVASDKDSELWNIAVKEGFNVLDIPEKVGGRYSVFSPTGLFPLGLLGINIERLLDGARSMRDTCINMNVEENPAAISAALQYLHYMSGKNISDLFLFANDLESLGKWCRQLMAESLGKEFNKKGETVNIGITPIISIGSTDLHSMTQLYLGGPYDKLTTFLSVENSNSHINVPKLKRYSILVNGIQGKSLESIMGAIMEGTKTAFRKGKRPFMEIKLPCKSEYPIGQFLQFKMIETIYLGFLLGVNPFDQPNVESYKEETRKILQKNETN